jgi:hypothetical protein
VYKPHQYVSHGEDERWVHTSERIANGRTRRGRIGVDIDVTNTGLREIFKATSLLADFSASANAMEGVTVACNRRVVCDVNERQLKSLA